MNQVSTTSIRTEAHLATYKQVRAIQRGFEVLLALNANGPLSIAAISLKTGINRTTLYRIVETLEALGYVCRSNIDETVRLTENVRRLSEGYDDGELLARAASSCLMLLLAETGWPSSVATRRHEDMIIRETTHGRAEVFVRDTTVGTKSPMLSTAMGRSYLSFCDDSERQEILTRIANSNSLEAPLAQNKRYVSTIIDETRNAGFGLSFSQAYPTLGAVALPVRSQGHVVGSVNIVFLKAFVGRRVAIEKFTPQLTKAVATIERNLEELRHAAS